MIPDPNAITQLTRNELIDLALQLSQKLKTQEKQVANIKAIDNEKKHLRKELDKNRKIIDAIFNASLETIAILDTEGNMMAINETGARRLDRKVSELIGLNISDFMPPETAQNRKKIIAEVVQSGKPLYVEDDSRENRYFQSSYYPVFNEQDEIINVTLFAREITGRSENKLRESHNRMLTILDSLEAIVYVADINTYEILFTNKYFRDHFGDTTGEVCWKRMQKDQSGPCEFCTNDKLMDQDGKPTGVYHWEFKNTINECWYDIRDRAIQWIDGRMVRMEIAIDITDRKQAEILLKNSESKYLSLFDNANDSIYLIDPMTMEIVDCNKKAAEITGYNLKELKSMTMTQLHPESELENFTEKINTIMEEGSLTGITGLHLLRKDRELVSIEVNATMIEVQGKKLNLSIVRDITERKKTEDNLREAKEKAEEATKLKDKFVSLVAHDLKAPFASILGLLHLINRDAGHLLSEKHKNMFERIQSSGKHLIRMIDELLKISRLQTGNIMSNPRFFDACTTTRKVVANLEFLAQEKGINLVIEVAAGTRMYADFDMFCEVIQNLVSNSIKFSRNGDTITIFTPKDQQSTIAVRDTGIGISNEILPKLFKYEEMTSTPGTAGEEGTGLGLPLSMDIMKLYGGTLEVESKKNKGSVFYAKLPPIKPKVMLVDNDPVDIMLFSELLKSLNVEIIEVESGIEALKIMKEEKPHLIFLDIIMPIMDGFTLIETIRSNPGTANIPIIVMTSDNNMETRDRAFQLGADDFVNKLITMEDFFPRVRRFIV